MRCPLQTPGTSGDKSDAYRSFLTNVEQFRAIDNLPTKLCFWNDETASNFASHSASSNLLKITFRICTFSKMHLIAQMYNIYNIHKHTLTLSGGHVRPVVDESTCCRRDREGCRRADNAGGRDESISCWRDGDGRRRAHNASGGDESTRCQRDGRMQAGYGEGRFSPTDQRQWTLQKSGLYMVTVAVTIGGKVDTAETVLVVILNSPQ